MYSIYISMCTINVINFLTTTIFRGGPYFLIRTFESDLITARSAALISLIVITRLPAFTQ